MKIETDNKIYIIKSDRDEIQSFKYQIYMTEDLYYYDIVKKLKKYNRFEYLDATFTDLIDILNILDRYDEIYDSEYLKKNNNLLRNEILKLKEVNRYLTLNKIKCKINGMERY